MTLQEFVGYCFTPSTRDRRSVIGAARGKHGIVPCAAWQQHEHRQYRKGGRQKSLCSCRFDHELVMLDDDMKLEALQTNNIGSDYHKAELPMDLRKRDSRVVSR